MRPLLLAALLAAAPAWAQVPTGDVDAGREIAKTWCANCHVIDNAALRAGDAVPSFPAIAALKSTTVLSLQVYLQTPHPRMPNFQLSRQQIDDASAYILSLRK
jgi:mono/diheme cytochrome c family protein